MDVRTLANLAMSTSDKDKATWIAVQAIMSDEQREAVDEAITALVAEQAVETVRKSLTLGDPSDDVIGEAHALMARAAEILIAHAPRNPRNSATWDGYVMRTTVAAGGVKVTLTV